MKTYGKGSKLRKGANLKAYWENYDAIFRKEPARDGSQTPLGYLVTPTQTTDPDDHDPEMEALAKLMQEQMIDDPGK